VAYGKVAMPAIDPADSAFWSVDTDQLLQQLGTTESGLTQAEAATRLANAEQLKPHRETVWSLLFDQFKSPIIILLFCSAILSFTLLDDRTNGVIIVVILIASGLLGFWQELSAANAVAKLMSMIETKANVIRDGQDLEVPLGSIVAGDVIRLRAGELIPGDCRLITSRDLFLNEAVLTGESFPVEKVVGTLPEQTSLARRVNSLYLGTHVRQDFRTIGSQAAGDRV
jgi:Mg2+-importing ATPase